MIAKRIAASAAVLLALFAVTCTCDRAPAGDDGKPKSDKAVDQAQPARGLVISAEAEKTEGEGETRPYVEPVLPEFVGGSLSQRAIAGEITAHVEELRACYNKGQKAKPDMKGEITLMFFLDDTGKVNGCEIRESQLGHEATDRCICDAVKTWQFPKPKTAGGVKVLYTFTFLP